MTTPTLVAATIAALATTAHAAPPRPKAPTPRPLLRPVVNPTTPAAAPFTNREGRPVCGNIANKGAPMRECVDAIGKSLQRQTQTNAGPAWITVRRDCTVADARVVIDPASGQADVTRAGKTAPVKTATSSDPAVIACRAGLS